MKTRTFSFMLAVAMLLMMCSGCKKNDGGDHGHGLSSMTFKKMDLTHAQMLALADTPAKDDPQYSPLYIVNDQGILESVEYTIEVEGDEGIANLVKANLQLKIHYIYQIGEDWLWLFDCRHYYPDIEQLSEDERNAINGLISMYDGIHYLVRKSDGAIFNWSLEDGRPWNEVNYGLERPSDYYGLVEQYGGDIVDVKHDWDGSQIYYLKDNGNSIQVRTMIPDGLYPQSVYPAKNDGVVGATIAYNASQGYFNYQPFVIFPGTLKIAQVIVPNFNNALETYSKLFSVDQRLYVMVTNIYEQHTVTDFRKVEIDLSNETVSVSAAIADVDYWVKLEPSCIGYYNPVFRDDHMFWLQNGNINTLYPETGYFTTQALPTYYPNDATEYNDGVAYVLDNQMNPTLYRVCDMSALMAVDHELVWDDISQYEGQIVVGSTAEWQFNRNSLAFTSYCMLLDGRKLNFFFSVIGDDAGQVHVITEGEGGGAGRVISTLIRLNGEN